MSISNIKQHHINDNLIIDDSLYVSVFSYSGNYKNDIYDGVILEYDLTNLKREPKVVVRDLTMPHSIKYFDSSIFVLDSFKGKLLGRGLQTIGQFPGFARGLSYDGRHFFIGQSKNRNHSYMRNESKNISIDSGIIIFDETTKHSRLLQLDPRMAEIHALEII